MSRIYSASDIAKLLIHRAQLDEPSGGERLTNLKLQKLLYYQQGYHLAAFDAPLFNEQVESWMYGPVVPTVYDEYSACGASTLSYDGELVQLSEEEDSLFNQVYEAYSDYSAYGLMNLTHKESPWMNAVPHNHGTVITQESMKEFFKTRFQ